MLFRSGGPLIKAESGSELFLRSVLLLSVVALVGVAFWYQIGANLREVNSRGAVWDEANVLSRDQREALRDFAAELKETYGIKLRLQIRKSPVVLPDLDNKTLFIGINPETRQVLIEFPTLLRKALGDEYMYRLQNEHFGPYFEKDQWQQGLAEALTQLWLDMGG
ncbi:TPM domain-containing protein [Desulfovibrio mangrovi]|uniref:TPM domain-containing protein n=1 Tax=Desulfovibrio mangrovi TaxID=2976983 RepID=UPI0022481FCE|nr:TPM domain-containing protein [Desulfovibrio mangrovi]UZP66020.1 TPM domain-containing protein [Desulfovibrio mangrovi]